MLILANSLRYPSNSSAVTLKRKAVSIITSAEGRSGYVVCNRMGRTLRLMPLITAYASSKSFPRMSSTAYITSNAPLLNSSSSARATWYTMTQPSLRKMSHTRTTTS